MTFLVNIPNRPLDKLITRLKQDIPENEIEIWPDVKDPDKVEFALVWKHQHGSLKAFKNLKAISSFGAGVDSIISDPDLPKVPICRIVDPDLAVNMAQYVLTMIQHHKLRLPQFNQQQSENLWKPKSPRKGNKVGVLGLGQLGRKTAEVLLNAGFDVSGWSRTLKDIDNVDCYTGDSGFKTLVTNSDYLVCLLPLTDKTHNILNADVFSMMPNHAVLINVARGEHVVDDDLIVALDNQVIDFAYLDVFRQEPLPAEHPFWSSTQIQITPHVSAVTNVETAVTQIVENYYLQQQIKPLKNVIDPSANY
ncbi:glyoxylate/hydroxypyruvate reductase A [Psychrosphaera sp. F3M07]|uniref:2-hydroxyacid dehydrogenase n=1 Tax=Psychrosphaera sp. F3M07 TaxID=2841560 RepID=UPI001C091665|nr:glyoxylate/hydroxypyruvate reductase A [Psychrosphaera sp. F3M07]MBU2916520.1 glyoxylate/hydroxypyruvate reductase A [Psychrosphaera sp. F3M07]